jgi:DNA helicase HerA-like ATPase
MMSELFEVLPEVGDPEKPKLVFFFDEAHLLFNDAPKALLEKVTRLMDLEDGSSKATVPSEISK